KANEPLHVLYAYDTGTVSVDNLAGSPQQAMSVEAKVYSVAGNLLDDQMTGGIAVGSQGVARNVVHPIVPPARSTPQTYFIELLLTRGGVVVDSNVYWLSTRPDVVNWKKTIGNPQAHMTRYANLRQLHDLAVATVRVTAQTEPSSAGAAGYTETDV